MTSYHDFLETKKICYRNKGFEVSLADLNPMLFDWQKVIVRWALFKGSAALFEDCGLGKTPQQLVWADEINKRTGGNILILAPLAVSEQTRREGVKFGVNVTVCRGGEDVRPGINITNYEMVHKFNPDDFIGVVLDESSILKNFAGKIKSKIIKMFRNTKYRLCCTATPSPNDYTELGNTAEFLGVTTRQEMLSMFFINDTADVGTWRMKGHVKNNVFWKWLCSWAVMIRKPSDIGYDDNGFVLPPLNVTEHIIPYDGTKKTLFVEEARTLSERREARKESVDARVKLASSFVNGSDETWIAWCDLNKESEALTAAIDGAYEIKGPDTIEHKESSAMLFSENKIKCLVTKPKIFKFGMNWQNCSNMVFTGISDSWESYYQTVRRSWRFGQNRPVNVHIVIEEREGSVLRNIKRKEDQYNAMFDGIVGYMKELMRVELGSDDDEVEIYDPQVDMIIPEFLEVA